MIHIHLHVAKTLTKLAPRYKEMLPRVHLGDAQRPGCLGVAAMLNDLGEVVETL